MNTVQNRGNITKMSLLPRNLNTKENTTPVYKTRQSKPVDKENFSPSKKAQLYDFCYDENDSAERKVNKRKYRRRQQKRKNEDADRSVRFKIKKQSEIMKTRRVKQPNNIVSRIKAPCSENAAALAPVQKQTRANDDYIYFGLDKMSVKQLNNIPHIKAPCSENAAALAPVKEQTCADDDNVFFGFDDVLVNNTVLHTEAPCSENAAPVEEQMHADDDNISFSFDQVSVKQLDNTVPCAKVSCSKNAVTLAPVERANDKNDIFFGFDEVSVKQLDNTVPNTKASCSKNVALAPVQRQTDADDDTYFGFDDVSVPSEKLSTKNVASGSNDVNIVNQKRVNVPFSIPVRQIQKPLLDVREVQALLLGGDTSTLNSSGEFENELESTIFTDDGDYWSMDEEKEPEYEEKEPEQEESVVEKKKAKAAKRKNYAKKAQSNKEEVFEKLAKSLNSKFKEIEKYQLAVE